jgi:hypothetical protein
MAQVASYLVSRHSWDTDRRAGGSDPQIEVLRATSYLVSDTFTQAEGV